MPMPTVNNKNYYYYNCHSELIAYYTHLPASSEQVGGRWTNCCMWNPTCSGAGGCALEVAGSTAFAAGGGRRTA